MKGFIEIHTTYFRCIDVYEEIKNKIEEAQ